MFAAPMARVSARLPGLCSTPAITVLPFACWFGGGMLAPDTVFSVMISHLYAIGAAAAALCFLQILAAAAAAHIQWPTYNGTVFPRAGVQVLVGIAAWTVWRLFGPDRPEVSPSFPPAPVGPAALCAR